MNKEIKCYICSSMFKRKYNLLIHLREFRCKSPLLDNLEKLNDLLKNLDNENNDLQKKIKRKVRDYINGEKPIKVNPITKLNLKNNMYNNNFILDNFDNRKCKENSLKELLTEYIKNIICNKDIPENMCITYIKRRPPTFNVVDKDTIYNIKSTKEICELYTDLFLKMIKKQMKKFKEYFNNRTDENDDILYDIYVIDRFKDLLKKDNITYIISYALKNVLNNYILYDKNMKYKGNYIINVSKIQKNLNETQTNIHEENQNENYEENEI